MNAKIVQPVCRRPKYGHCDPPGSSGPDAIRQAVSLHAARQSVIRVCLCGVAFVIDRPPAYRRCPVRRDALKTHAHREAAMQEPSGWKSAARHVAGISGAILIGTCVSLAAQAQRVPAGCTALVTVANDLYSARVTSEKPPTGDISRRFTTDGAPKSFVTFSPRGDKVAYLTGHFEEDGGPESGTFHVVDETGRRGSFEIDPGGRDVKADAQFAGGGPYLTGLKWNSDDVLRLQKWSGKDYALFEFRRIPNDLSGTAPEAARHAVAENCVVERTGGPVACIDQAGFIALNGIDGKPIYSVPVFTGAPVLESFELHVGQSYTPHAAPGTAIKIKGISHDTVDIKMTPSDPKYPWSETFDRSGSYTEARDYKIWAKYGYFITIVNAKTGLVRIRIRRDDTPDQLVDLGLARLPHGRGLLFIRRSNTGAFLDLIRPGGGRGDAGRGTSGRSQPWHLAAEAPVSLAHPVSSMRFLTPSSLLIQYVDRPPFNILPVHITNGRAGGKSSLTAGRISPLPRALAVSIKGQTTHAAVLGWGCKATSAGKPSR